jgi:hypothetical protein
MKKSIFLSVFTLALGFATLTGCGTDPNKPKTREERIAETQEAIRNSPDWLNAVKAKAEMNKIPLDSMILKDAVWMVDDQDGLHKEPAAPAPAPGDKPAEAPAPAGDKPAAPAPAGH